MSVTTWRKEFYPVQVKENPKRSKSKISKAFLLKLVDQAILKWTGLLPKNRKKHNVDFPRKFKDYTLYSLDESANSEFGFHVDGTTCSLCAVFDDMGRISGCTLCPLYLSLGNKKCTDFDQPYSKFMDSYSVQPMIKELKKAREYVETEEYFEED